ncbi:MAG: hypothetical protein Q9M28_10640 [Mariprofundaceae bacterium]|nr:hypothetical protein [Mariprofundaceae bacterium]
MMFLKISLPILLICMWAAPASAVLHWQPAPSSKDNMQHQRMAHKSFILVDGQGAYTHLIHPDLKKDPLLDTEQHFAVKPTGKNNYHALIAQRTTSQGTETAVRYPYFHGRPTGFSPSKLTDHAKFDFEIIPMPLAREHWKYTANQEASFQLRFKGKPLAKQSIQVTTSQGTAFDLKTDSKGMLSFIIPDDFSEVKVGQRKNPKIEFLLHAQTTQNNHHYQSSFSSFYVVDPNHWRSLPWGFVALFFGMMIGLLIHFKYRNIKKGKR